MDAHSHGLNKHTHSFSGTTGGMSANATGSFNARRSDVLEASEPIDRSGNVTRSNLFRAYKSDSGSADGIAVNYYINVSHTHSFSGTTDGSSGNTTSTTTIGNFQGREGTTGGSGSGTSFSIMPPYVVKYCFERTA